MPDPSSEIVVLVVLQAPPDTKLLNDIDKPTHTEDAPIMPDGAGLTVTTVVIEQDAPVVYVIFAVPAVTPLTIPVEAPTPATDGLLVDQVPEPSSVSAVVAPAHTTGRPMIGVGAGFIITVTVLVQPAGTV